MLRGSHTAAKHHSSALHAVLAGKITVLSAEECASACEAAQTFDMGTAVLVRAWRSRLPTSVTLAASERERLVLGRSRTAHPRPGIL